MAERTATAYKDIKMKITENVYGDMSYLFYLEMRKKGEKK